MVLLLFGIQLSSFKKLKILNIQACLMVIAWVLFAPTGMLIARYYKFLLDKRKVCSVNLWFALHLPIMLSVPIISFVGLLVVLSWLNWKWVQPESGDEIEFSHSVLGILAISLAFFQVIKKHDILIIKS